MNRKITLTLGVLSLSCLLSCHNSEKPKYNKVISITHELGTTEVPLQPKRVFVYDMGSLETLNELGIPVAGIPKDFVPKHLKKYKDNPKVQDVGSILQPNLEKLSALDPELIIISNLHAHDYDELSKIAATISLGPNNNDYLKSVIDNINNIGKIFTSSDKTTKKTATIRQQIDDAATLIAQSPKKIMILMYNAGAYSSFGRKSRYSYVFTDLKAKPADNNTEKNVHGAIVSSEYIADINPDILFIIDRNAIMTGHQANHHVIENVLIKRTTAYKNNSIYYLDPNVWYISGGGIYSLQQMTQDILAGYTSKNVLKN